LFSVSCPMASTRRMLDVLTVIGGCVAEPMTANDDAESSATKDRDAVVCARDVHPEVR